MAKLLMLKQSASRQIKHWETSDNQQRTGVQCAPGQDRTDLLTDTIGHSTCSTSAPSMSAGSVAMA
eukprot:CAMPEP_0204072758 /NCGR_PEP_ID=MMETSP0360-20130528/162240_1 /ASSEMBLY_ACC=CAM_ASM_000342 /TAXON_ID=268821 /ORGANISM="Scrippsiella Hangoei, Strain SHTV-5" /LENGTH=65 /DNA_ID=CAMNT_0051021105 /DNA_START=148 /DNA_END=345 /DNA_ORIENTATION=+